MTLPRVFSLLLPVTVLLRGVGGNVVRGQPLPTHSVGTVPTAELSPAVKRSVLQSVRGRDGNGKDGPMARLGMELSVLFHQYRREGSRGVQRLRRGHRVPDPKVEREEWSESQNVRSPISADGQFVTVEAISTEGNDGTVTLRWKQIGGDEVDRFVVEQKFFGGTFTEKTSVSVRNEVDYRETIPDLPVGTHMFRVSAVRNDSTLTAATIPWTIRGKRANVLMYPNPFRDVVNLSITLPFAQNTEEIRVTVYDALGREVSVPIDVRSIEGAESIPVSVEELGTLGAGVYFFRVKGESFVKTLKGVRME